MANIKRRFPGIDKGHRVLNILELLLVMFTRRIPRKASLVISILTAALIVMSVGSILKSPEISDTEIGKAIAEA